MKLAKACLLAHATLAALLLAPAHSVAANSTMSICNVGNTSLFVVIIGRTERGGYAIDGWREIRVGGCHDVAVTWHSIVGFAVAANGGKRMQVYDPARFPNPALLPTEWKFCVDPEKDFHREHATLKRLTVCETAEVLGRFAFHVKPKLGETLTVEIPADGNGEVIPFQVPASVEPYPGFATALKGLAEQQQRLGFRIEQQDRSPIARWPAYYLRELGTVVRPQTNAASVVKGSPADKAGIRHRDEIVQIDGINLRSAWHARSLLVRTKPGETHAISFVRAGQLHREEIRLQALPGDLASTDLHPGRGWLGMELESSARVAAVIYRDGTPHLEIDDEIQRIGRMDFDGPEGLAEWLARHRESATIELQVRQASTGRIVVTVLEKLQ